MSANNFSLTTELQHETIRTTWKIKDFQAICDTLNASNTTCPYVDSPGFGVGKDGPQFYLCLYSNGSKEELKEYYSLYLYLKSVGNDRRWLVEDGGSNKVRIKFDVTLLDKNGHQFSKVGT